MPTQITWWGDWEAVYREMGTKRPAGGETPDPFRPEDTADGYHRPCIPAPGEVQQ